MCRPTSIQQIKLCIGFFLLSLPMLDASLYSTARSVFSLRITIMCHVHARSQSAHSAGRQCLLSFLLFIHAFSVSLRSIAQSARLPLFLFLVTAIVCLFSFYFFSEFIVRMWAVRAHFFLNLAADSSIVFFCIWHSASALVCAFTFILSIFI